MRSGTFGRQSYCRECARAVARERYTANAEAERARALAYYHDNRERQLETARAWKVANPERVRELRRNWYREHPEVLSAENARRRQRRRSREYDAYVEHVEPLIVLERDDGVCGICGGDVDPFDFHVDHIVPLACGGLHHYENVQAAHPRCNQVKGARVAA